MIRYLKAKAYGRDIELELKDRCVLVEGNSGSGRTLVFDVFNEISYINKSILCINAEILRNAKKTFKQYKANAKNKVIFVDNADLILTADARKSIVKDDSNQYVIFGRNSKGLPVTNSSFAEVADDSKKITFIYPFEPKPILDFDLSKLLP